MVRLFYGWLFFGKFYCYMNTMSLFRYLLEWFNNWFVEVLYPMMDILI
jgi:hypothetical protein